MHYNLPTNPGCYLMKDSAGDIIYVGKAKNLKKRVSSYFSKDHKDSPKTQLLVKNISDIDFVVVDNEVEALLLENRLIKKHKPKYNISLKDDKRYAYLCLTDEEFPRLISTRDTKMKGKYFGPFTDGSARYHIQRLAQRLFKIRTCKNLPKKVCLLYHIKRCKGPCENFILKEEYHESIKKCELLLKGDTKALLHTLEKQMQEYSQNLAFEYAMECRDQIDAIHAISEKQKVDVIRNYDEDYISFLIVESDIVIGLFHVKKGVITEKKQFRFSYDDSVFEDFIKSYYAENPIASHIILEKELEDDAIKNYLEKICNRSITFHVPQKGDKKKLLELVKKNIELSFTYSNEELDALQKFLQLQEPPRIIDCFDMSNFGSKFQIGACIRFVDGKPDKNLYRRFKIKSFLGQDDFLAMYECVKRRFHKYAENAIDLPDLIIIDGGKGQLGMAQKALKELALHIPIISLAKKEEEIFVPGLSSSLKINLQNKGLHLVQRARDEAHRFVVSYHRLLRSKEMEK